VLTRDRVVAESLAITSATGAAALSMRTLATRLGVVPAALDRHVRSKEQLYDVILDGALAGVDCQADPAPRTGQVTALAPGLPADLQPRHRLRPLIEVTRQPRPGTGSPRRSPGDTVRLTHPNLVHAGNASKRYGHAAAAALPGQWRHVEGSRQMAGRACVQIDRICTHNECARHDSAAVPNGGSGVSPEPYRSRRNRANVAGHGTSYISSCHPPPLRGKCGCPVES
jgi:AcrR family transcriptional regulator